MIKRKNARAITAKKWNDRPSHWVLEENPKETT
jgi:hypothetical protein